MDKKTNEKQGGLNKRKPKKRAEILFHFIGVILVIIGVASALYLYIVGTVMRLFGVNLLEGGYEALNATIAIIALLIAFAAAFFSTALKRRDMIDSQKRHEDFEQMMLSQQQIQSSLQQTLSSLQQTITSLQQTLERMMQQPPSGNDTIKESNQNQNKQVRDEPFSSGKYH